MSSSQELALHPCLVEEQALLSFTGHELITEWAREVCNALQLGNVASAHHLLTKLQPQLLCEPLYSPFIQFPFLSVPSAACSALSTQLKVM